MSLDAVDGRPVIRCDVTAPERAGRCPSMLDVDLYESTDHWRSLGWHLGTSDVCPFHAALPGQHRDAAVRAARVAAAQAALAELTELRDRGELTGDETLVVDRTERLVRPRPGGHAP